MHALCQAGDKVKGNCLCHFRALFSLWSNATLRRSFGESSSVTSGVCDARSNPQVAGRGIAMLRQAGIQVDVGLLEADAIALNPGFIKRMKTGMPYVQLKLAASLDGKTALANGHSQWITSPQARQDVQRYRAKAGAILSTAKTVLDDDASLNVRWQELPQDIQAQYSAPSLRQPVRVILDRQQQLSEHPKLKLFHSEGDLLLVGQDTGLAENQVVAALDHNQQFDLPKLLKQLAEEHNINHIWVEAGATLATNLITQQLIDELIIYMAPKLMGTDGRGLTQIAGFTEMKQALDLNITDLRMVGKDLRITACLNQ